MDNRLSLDPNDERFAFASEWRDGAEYSVELRVRQISPGEFEVVSGEGEEPADAIPEGETGSMGVATDEYPNPAVAKMAGKGMMK